jgi:hypothetical protein
MSIKSVYREVGLESTKVFPKSALKRNDTENKKAKKNSPIVSRLPDRKKGRTGAPHPFTNNNYYNRPGYYISVRDGKKINTILIFATTMREAIAQMKAQNPTKRIIHIEKHYGGTE